MTVKPGRQYIVVENSGMVGEQDVGKFGTLTGAVMYIERTYTERERDRQSPYCLHPAVCLEEDGARTYDI